MRQAFPDLGPDTLYELHAHLRSIARVQLAAEGPGHTLQATALVHEAALRLLAREPGSFETLADYVAATAQAMGRVLVDHARRRARIKRGAGARRLALSAEVIDAASAEPWELCAVDDALGLLSQEHPGLAEIVRLRVFGGLTTSEIGSCLGLCRQTVERRWRFASAVLRSALEPEADLGP